MCVSSLGMEESLTVVRFCRDIANPNFGFRMQLKKFAEEQLEKVRARTSLAVSSVTRGLSIRQPPPYYNHLVQAPSSKTYTRCLKQPPFFLLNITVQRYRQVLLYMVDADNDYCLTGEKTYLRQVSRVPQAEGQRRETSSRHVEEGQGES